MGLETAALVVSAVAVAAESAYEIKAANMKKHALDLQAKSMKVETQQKTLKNYDVMEKMLQAQEVHQAMTGTAFSSPSFNAIQLDTLNEGSKRQSNIDIEGSILQANNRMEKQAVGTTLFAQLFGNAASASSTAFTAARNAPSKGK